MRARLWHKSAMDRSHSPHHAPLSQGFPPVLAWLIALNLLPEAILQMSDQGIIGPPCLRALAYHLGAFQPDLLTASGPLYPGHSLVMFFTYGFLHTGLPHLAVNMLTLVWLGRIILSYRTSETFLIVYLMSMVGAAEVFALIGPAGGDVVGASGALFGLLGLYAVDNKVLIPDGSKNRPIVQIAWLILATAALGVTDLVSQILLGAPVAWQAHAGGFVAGALVAFVSPPRYASAR